MEKELHRVGIMGGTFDPIHIGHLLIAQSALEEMKLDKVLFMPSGKPPHKDSRQISDAKIRSDLVNLSIDNQKKFVYSDFEINRRGYIYTSDTLSLLREQYPDWELFFIMGADSLYSIDHWHEPETIFQKCHIVVADRDGHNGNILEEISRLTQKYHASIRYIASPIVMVSSTIIRERIRQGRSIRYLVTESVEKYIDEHQLYRT